MNATPENLDNVARRLDGQDARLTAAELKLAEEIRRDEAEVLPVLEVNIPPGVMHRANARLAHEQAAANRHARVVWRRVLPLSVAAAVAAMLLVLTVKDRWTADQPDQAIVKKQPRPRTQQSPNGTDYLLDELAGGLGSHRWAWEVAETGLDTQMPAVLLGEDSLIQE